MATKTVTFFSRNLLDWASFAGTFSVTGTADTGYPETRLYDRARALFWKLTGTQAVVFQVDQGATPQTVCGFLAIPSHNFDGLAMTFQYSDNGTAWADAVTPWTQDGNGQIIKALSANLTKRHWRVTVASITNPQASEIFFGNIAKTFNVLNAVKPKGNFRDNVSWIKTIGGQERSTKHGDTRRARHYTFWLSPSELVSFDDMYSDLDELSRPFWIKDHKDEYYLARFEDPPTYDYNHATHTRVTARVIEML